MSLFKLIVDSLRFHWRTNLAVMLAVAAASAVLTGALVVGDSMRGSLRHLVLDQLGAIDDLLVTDRFFRAELAEELAREPQYQEYFGAAVPAVVVQGSVENPLAGGALRAGRVTVFGVDESFWQLGSGGPQQTPGRNEIVLNAALAREIGAKAGDDVLLRIGSVSQIPPDSALGRKTETIRNRRLKVSEVIAAEGLGRLALHPSQQLPHDAFVASETLQDALEQDGKVNAIFVAGKSGVPPSVEADDALAASFHPELIDYGIEFSDEPAGFVQVQSNRMLLDPPAVRAVLKTYADCQPQQVFTYLANTIAAAGHEIPYSTITAIDFRAEPPLGPFASPDGKPITELADNEIALNTWAADDLGVEPGAEVEITYFEPESTHAVVRESKARFRLKAIVAIEGAAADKNLTPQMPGVTDRLTIGDWDAPFPFEPGRVRKKDEDYWDQYRTTPKAFVSLAAGRRMWSSRFGNTTAIRLVPPAGQNAASLAAHLHLDPDAFGFRFMPVKRLGLAAASGTTPFDALFIGFSLFIMVSALLLVALLFRLGIEQRVTEIGILRAVGIGRRRVAMALAGEGLLVALVGSALGAAAGAGYAALMLAGLTTWWLSAISTPFLELYVQPGSLVIGLFAGRWCRSPRYCGPSGGWGASRCGGCSRGKRWKIASRPRGPCANRKLPRRCWPRSPSACACRPVRCGAKRGPARSSVPARWCWPRACCSFGRGCAGRDCAVCHVAIVADRPASGRNGARNPSRSTLSIGLVAAASFLIIALSAFRLDPAAEGRGPDSGSGGFNVVAQSDLPIYQDLSTPAGRAELGLPAKADAELARCDIIAMRVRAGDDASCLNLYQPTDPRMLGANQRLIERGGFSWAASAAESAEEKANPWLLLDRALADDPDGTPVLPAIVDFNTAEYSLHKGSLGQSIEVTDGHGRPLRLRFVGFLKNSIFQGDVVIRDQALLAHFPHVNGYRFFLVDTHDEPAAAVEQALEGPLGDFGMDAQTTAARLEAFFAVQNTYLSTFQSLGGLGLLLGTFGLATVQLRSVLERRGELALMRAEGFRRALLARLVMLENALLLVAGLGVGVLAALVAVLPYWLSGGATVPWLSLAGTMTLVLVVGLLAGLVAVRATLAAELIPALREE